VIDDKPKARYSAKNRQSSSDKGTQININASSTPIEYPAGYIIDDVNTVYRLWPYIHGFWEFSTHLTVLVTVYFWCVELPCMGERGDYNELTWPYWFALIFDHSVPVIVMTMEWCHNSIEVEWNRLILYVAGSYAYVIVLLVAAFVYIKSDSGRTYASMPFYTSPYAANFAIVGVFVLQTLSFWFVKWATEMKFQLWGDLVYPDELVESKA